MVTSPPLTKITARTQILLAGLLGFSLLLWWGSISATVALALRNEAHTHILLIVPLSMAMILLDKRVLHPNSRIGIATATLFLVAGLVIAGVAKCSTSIPDDVRLSLSMLGLVAWWLGCFVLYYGSAIFKSLLFPLFFVLWIVPIPQSLLNWMIEWLQIQSATAARLLFHLARVPVTQDGIMLSIPGLDLEVASQCSSIRSSLMLLITTMVLAHLFLTSWWRKALVVAAAIPLAAIKNGLRIFVIGELTTRVDRGFLDGDFHHHGGFVFFAISVLVSAMLIWILRRTEKATRSHGAELTS